MKIQIKDCRDEDLRFLGFISVDDGANHLHASVSILSDGNVLFENFKSGNIGKYRFKADDFMAKLRGGDNGGAFIGAGRGRKPDSAFEEMKNFIRNVDSLQLNINDMNKTVRKFDTQYDYEV